MAEIMLRYKVPGDFVYRLSRDTQCIFCPGLIEVAVCEEMFIAKFFLLLHPFNKHLLTKYGLVPT